MSESAAAGPNSSSGAMGLGESKSVTKEDKTDSRKASGALEDADEDGDEEGDAD
jgi:hypothetical protein